MFSFSGKDEKYSWTRPVLDNEPDANEALQTAGLVFLILFALIVVFVINKFIMKIFVWLISILVIALILSGFAIYYLWKQTREMV